jgi:hypothetical protein
MDGQKTITVPTSRVPLITTVSTNVPVLMGEVMPQRGREMSARRRETGSHL